MVCGDKYAANQTLYIPHDKTPIIMHAKLGAIPPDPRSSVHPKPKFNQTQRTQPIRIHMPLPYQCVITAPFQLCGHSRLEATPIPAPKPDKRPSRKVCYRLQLLLEIRELADRTLP
jgi:hypothetical protein